jgi:hypothetical protein
MSTKQNVQEYIAERFKPSDIEEMSATRGTGALVLLPTTMGEAMEFAKLMAVTTAVPPHLRGKPGDCLAITMQAMRWTMDPFAVASKSYFVNDRLAYESQLVNAVIYSHAPLEGRLNIEYEGEGADLVCRVTGKIKDDPNPHTVVQEAKTITTKNSPLWKQAPRQQLAYYTTREWARLYAPDVLMGVYTPDEVDADWRYQGAGRAKDVTPRPRRSDFKDAEGDPVDPDKPLRQHYAEKAADREEEAMDAQYAATVSDREPAGAPEPPQDAQESGPATDAAESEDAATAPAQAREMGEFEADMRAFIAECRSPSEVSNLMLRQEPDLAQQSVAVQRTLENVAAMRRAELGGGK